MNSRPETYASQPTRRAVLLAGSGAGLLGMAQVVAPTRASAAEPRLRLANDGHTRYQVYCGADEDATVQHAASELASYLESITSARFPVVRAEQPPAGEHLLVVGRNNPLTARLSPAVDYATLG
jgi:hypothetical protein